MNLHDIHYLFPQAAYLIFLGVIIPLLLWRLFQYRKQTLEEFAAPSLLKSLAVLRSPKAFFAKALCLCLSWIALVFALMQPTGYGYYPQQMTNSLQSRILAGEPIPHLVVFLMDASASMTVDDSQHRSRFDLSKDIANEIVTRLTGERVALHAFTSEVTQLIPQTYNYLFLRIMIKQLRINEGGEPGTSISGALKDMQERYYATPTPLLKTLIILSDGGDTYLETLQGAARDREIDLMLELIGDPERNHLRIYTIGLGSLKEEAIPEITFEGKPVLSALDKELLKKISQRGRGKYYRANDFSPKEIASDLTVRMQQDIQKPEQLVQNSLVAKGSGAQDNLAHNLYFQIYLGIAIFLFVLSILIPDIKK
jgi:Ca-activated chloride channel family protein